MAYYCLHEFHLLPSRFMALDIRERAFITAAIQIKVENDKKREAKIRRNKPSKRR